MSCSLAMDGSVKVVKVASTPDDYSRAVIEDLRGASTELA